MTLTTVAGLASDLGAQVDPPEHRVDFDIAGCRIRLETNEAALAERLRHYFRAWTAGDGAGAAGTRSDGGEAGGGGPEGGGGGPAPDFVIVALEGPEPALDVAWTVKQPEPGKTKVKEEWVDLPDGRVVRKRTTGMVFAFGGSLHLAFGPCLANDNQVVNFVNNRYMQWRLAGGYVLAHAGAVGRDGRCLALCGPSGAGKSTAALGLVCDGLDFVSNDRLLMRRDATGVDVHGIPKHPRVNPGTIVHNPRLEHMIDDDERARLLSLPADALRTLEDKYDVIIDDLVGPDRFRMHGRLAALVVFNWTAEGRPSAAPVDLATRPELLPLIAKSPGLFYEPEDGVAERAIPGIAGRATDGRAAGDEIDPGNRRLVDTLSGARVVEITGRQDFDEARRLCLEVLDGVDA